MQPLDFSVSSTHRNMSMKRRSSPLVTKKKGSFIGAPNITPHPHLHHDQPVAHHCSGAVHRNQFNPVMKVKSGREGTIADGGEQHNSKRERDHGKAETLRYPPSWTQNTFTIARSSPTLT